MSADRRVGFTIVRMLDATPERVWRMWTDPTELTHWLHPDGVDTPVDSIHFDVREGGRLSYTMIDGSTGSPMVMTGVFREVDPQRRLVFSWGEEGQTDDEAMVVAVDLVDHGERTELTLHVRGVPDDAGDDVSSGWGEALRLLAVWIGPGVS